MTPRPEDVERLAREMWAGFQREQPAAFGVSWNEMHSSWRAGFMGAARVVLRTYRPAPKAAKKGKARR